MCSPARRPIHPPSGSWPPRISEELHASLIPAPPFVIQEIRRPIEHQSTRPLTVRPEGLPIPTASYSRTCIRRHAPKNTSLPVGPFHGSLVARRHRDNRFPTHQPKPPEGRFRQLDRTTRRQLGPAPGTSKVPTRRSLPLSRLSRFAGLFRPPEDEFPSPASPSIQEFVSEDTIQKYLGHSTLHRTMSPEGITDKFPVPKYHPFHLPIRRPKAVQQVARSGIQ
jgi:hypothetical protein